MNDKKPDAYASDTYLTELFWDKNENAIKMANEKYRKLIFSTILTILGNREESEECLNDVYMKLWSSIPPQRPVSFRAYAVKIARNAAIGRLKALGAQKRNCGAVAYSLEALGDAVPAQSCEDEEKSRLIGQIIEKYLDSSDDKTMYIFMKRYYFGVSIDEIARSMKCSRSSVNQYIKKIKTELKARLAEGGIDV